MYTKTMSFAQQKQCQYVQLSQTIQHIVNELSVSRDLISETSRQISAMGKFGALHAAQLRIFSFRFVFYWS
jgi:hypothetical protein